MNIFEFGMLAMQAGAFGTATLSWQGHKMMYWAGAFVLTLAVVRGLR